MNYLHYPFDLGSTDAVEVTLDKRANVRLMDDANFNRYREGKTHRYHGGYAKQRVVKLIPPSPGHWHVVIDLGGYPGTVRASARVLEGAT